MNKTKRLLLLVIIVIFAIFLLNIVNADGVFSIDSLKNILKENKLSGILVFTLIFCIGNLLYIPGFIFIAAPVALFTVPESFLIVYTAGLVSCCVSFYFISFFGNDLLRTFDNRVCNWAFSNIDKRPILSVAILRTFMQTSPVLNYSLSLCGIKFHNYLIGSTIGLVVPIFIYCFVFSLGLK